MPKVELEHGIRFDANYYYWPGAWMQNRPGFMTGSGMPMRFADLDGTLIDVFQATTQMTDESGQTYPFTVDTLLDKALGPGATTASSPRTCTPTPPLRPAPTPSSLRLRPGRAVVSGRQMLTWLDGRDDSRSSRSPGTAPP